MQQPKLSVEYVDTGALAAYAGNTRVHDGGQIGEIGLSTDGSGSLGRKPSA